jgi:hypothetical protein
MILPVEFLRQQAGGGKAAAGCTQSMGAVGPGRIQEAAGVLSIRAIRALSRS